MHIPPATSNNKPVIDMITVITVITAITRIRTVIQHMHCTSTVLYPTFTAVVLCCAVL